MKSVKGEPDRWVKGVLMRMAAMTIMLTFLALGVGGYRKWRNEQVLSGPREAWEVEEAAYKRLLQFQEKLERSEAACGELAGSWQVGMRLGAVLRASVELVPPSIEVGKIDITCEYGYDATNPDDSLRDLPTREREMLIAGRCYGESMDREVLAYQESIRSAAAVGAVAESVRLEGVERVASARDPRGSEHMVFALRVAFPSESMALSGGGE